MRNDLFGRVLGSRLVRNSVWLGAVQIAGMLVPILSVPWLTRSLGVEAWGSLLYIQSLAVWMSAIVEYGFSLSATRSLAPVREDIAQCKRYSSAVLTAKLLLGLPCVAVYGAAFVMIPALRQDPSMCLAGLVFALLQGMHPMWFFHTMERLSFVSALDLANRFISLGLIVLLVRRPDQAHLVLWIQAGLQGLSTAVATLLQWRSCGGLEMDLRGAICVLREGVGLFLFRASVSLYTSANGFLLGTFSSTQQVAYFGAGERIAKASLALLMPITQAVYPRINALHGSSPEKAKRLIWLTFWVTQVLAWIGAASLVWLAPWIIPIALGPGFDSAVPVLQTLAVLLPLIAASNVFGIQFLLPRRLDGAFNGIILVAGFANCLISILIAPKFGAGGMAWTVVAAEALVTGAMGVKVWTTLRNEARGVSNA